MGASRGQARHPVTGVPRMTNPWITSAAALFLGWFSTGAILWRVRRADLGGPDDHLWSVLLGLPLLVFGVMVLHASVDDASVRGVYLVFLSALAILGWIELAFLSGVITGPNRSTCPPGLPLGQRFMRATGTVIWHELRLLAGLLMIAPMSFGTANEFGLWTFGVLFFARISAKFNLFFGVPRIHTEFLPRPETPSPTRYDTCSKELTDGFPEPLSHPA